MEDSNVLIYDQSILYLILAFSLFLWLLTISTITVFDISIDARFGLMQYMPWYFWVGVFLLSLANGLGMLGLGTRVTRLSLLIVTMLFVWGTPCFVMPTVTGDAYWHASTSMRLTRTGYIDSSVATSLEWPGSFIIGSALTLITEIDAHQLVQYYPILNGFLLTIGFYMLSKRILGSDHLAFISTTFMIMGQMFIQLHYSPYGTALSIFPIILYLLLSEDAKRRSMGMLLSFCLVITHAITPVFLVLILGIVPWLFSILFQMRSGHPFTAIIILTSYVGWLIYAAITFSSYVHVGQRFYNMLLDLSRFEAVRESYFGYTPPEISYLRKGVFAFYWLAGFLGIISRFKTERSSKDPLYAVRAGMLIIPSALVFLVPYILGPIWFTTRPLDFAIFGSSINLPIFFSFLHLGKKSICSRDNSKQTMGLLNISHRFLNKKYIIVLCSIFLLFPGVTLPHVEMGVFMTRQSSLAGDRFVATMATNDTLIYSLPYAEYIFFNINLTERNVRNFDFDHPYESRHLDAYDIIVFRYEAYLRYSYGYISSPYINGRDYVESSPAFLNVYDSKGFHVYATEEG